MDWNEIIRQADAMAPLPPERVARVMRSIRHRVETVQRLKRLGDQPLIPGDGGSVG